MSRQVDETWQLGTFHAFLEDAREEEENERELKSSKSNESVKNFRVRCDSCKNYGHQITVCRKKAKADLKLLARLSPLTATTWEVPNNNFAVLRIL